MKLLGCQQGMGQLQMIICQFVSMAGKMAHGQRIEIPVDKSASNNSTMKKRLSTRLIETANMWKKSRAVLFFIRNSEQSRYVCFNCIYMKSLSSILWIPFFTQRQECKTTYKKNCFIESRPKASSVKIEVCHENYVRDCDVSTRDSPEECTQERDTGILRNNLLLDI